MQSRYSVPSAHIRLDVHMFGVFHELLLAAVSCAAHHRQSMLPRQQVPQVVVSLNMITSREDHTLVQVTAVPMQ